ncbi:endo-1-4-beta-xylanase B [Apiospora rasikravindrae]|uniref:Endo-1-4-beta-xylanase B n=1 Tax=Apiospora rasikravindrae TaxID=990691 RepID=A0ABR1TWH2_9PEZI
MAHLNLTFYPAPEPNGTGVLVLPGGGYGNISWDNEGPPPAAWLNERGFDAWILRYTVDSHRGAIAPVYPAPIDEAVEAVEHIRASGRVSTLGVWGFSAGGHLAAITATTTTTTTGSKTTNGTKAGATEEEAGSEKESLSSIVDFAILTYPVITMHPDAMHEGSLRNLIGLDAAEDVRLGMCAETRVGAHTPPVFLFHTSNDPIVPVQNTLLFAGAMARHRRPFRLVILPDGPHGIGLAINDEERSWTGELERWIVGFVEAEA